LNPLSREDKSKKYVGSPKFNYPKTIWFETIGKASHSVGRWSVDGHRAITGQEAQKETEMFSLFLFFEGFFSILDSFILIFSRSYFKLK